MNMSMSAYVCKALDFYQKQTEGYQAISLSDELFCY